MITKTTNYLSSLFGVLLIMGGLMGFIKAGSVISLIAGACSGIGVLAVQKLVQSPENRFRIIMAFSLVLAYTFNERFRVSGGKFLPSGFMAVTSCVVCTLCIAALFRLKSDKLNSTR